VIVPQSECAFYSVPDELESVLSAMPKLKDQTAIDMVKAHLAGFEKHIRMVTRKQDVRRRAQCRDASCGCLRFWHPGARHG
jgi:hypothetical protein